MTKADRDHRRVGAHVLQLPSYGISEAAHYLAMPVTTLRAWFLGQKGFSAPLKIAQRNPPALSFLNLIEAHVLEAIRRQHGVTLQNVRKALVFLSKHFPSEHPLATRQFETDGLDLFIEHCGSLLNVSREGQGAMRDVLAASLRRVERSPSGVPVRLFPHTRRGQVDEPRSVVIDPRVSFGRPVLAGTGVPTEIIAERYKAGETMDQLAEDYGRQRSDIEEAIRYELQIQPQAA